VGRLGEFESGLVFLKTRLKRFPSQRTLAEETPAYNFLVLVQGGGSFLKELGRAPHNRDRERESA